ncbi:MAG: hypothetical protein AB1810_09070 [Pseudomonadota bacterium]
MEQAHLSAESALDHLDRGVVLFTLGGVVFNATEASLAGVLLTALATLLYAVTRNRIANLEDFEFAESLPSPPGIDLGRFTLICQWLGSRQLFEGLLGDLVDPEIGGSAEAARRHIRAALWPALWARLREKIQALFWMDR